MKSFLQNMGFVKPDETTQENKPFVENPKTTFPSRNPAPTFFDPESKEESKIMGFPEPAIDFKQESQGFKDEINPYLDQLRKAYNDQFTKLNKPDVDFFEIFQGLSKFGNLESAEALKMALSMTSGNLTKEVLDTQANQYAKTLMDNFNQLKKQGENKLEQVKSQWSSTESSLIATISELKRKISEAELQLTTINEKFDPQVREIKLKSGANQIAYSELMDKINKVQNNIKNNL